MMMNLCEYFLDLHFVKDLALSLAICYNPFDMQFPNI